MFKRRAPLACLALLIACGGNETEKQPASTKSTATAKTSETPATTTKPLTTPAPTKPAPAPTAPSTAKPAPTPSAPATTTPVIPPPEAPGIVHTTPPAVPPIPPVEDDGLLLDTPKSVEPARAVAYLSPSSASHVSGTVTFVAQATGVEVRVQLEGLTPGKHGLHVHETGDCSSSDASSAGAHFNPGNSPHGGPDSPAHHAGDFGNVEADAAGRVDTTFLDRSLSLTGTSSIVGRAVVVHADPDDLVTQPAGNSGVRIACGVIEQAPATGGG
jgi:Cu-Zn family superoxide dismutase